MTRRLSRREALAGIGGLATAGLAGLAGCIDDDRYWDDPPEFDATSLDDVLDEPVPDRPRLVPASFDPSVAEGFRDRVERLLTPIPDPLTESRLPNGAFRERIRSQRATAREELSDVPEVSDAGESRTLTTLETAERLTAARGAAADAVGTWAAVTTEGDPGDLTPAVGSVNTAIDRLADTLPGAAADPTEALAVYAPVERWLDVASRRTMVGPRPDVVSQEDPLRVGRAVCTLEEVSAQVEVGRHLRDRYRATLADPVDAEPALRRAANALGEDAGDRLRELYDGEVDRFRGAPGRDAFLDDPGVPRSAPSRDAFGSAYYRTFEDFRFDPVVVTGEWKPDHPATTLWRTALFGARLDALSTFAARVTDGEDLFPADGHAVAAARADALESVRALASADDPVRRRFGLHLRETVARPDETFENGEPSTRAAAEAHAAYRWAETLAVAGEETSEAVGVAFGG